MKLALLLIFALLGILFSSQASAWRHASLRLAQRAKIYRSLTDCGTVPEDGLAVSETMIQEFEPPFVAWRKRIAIVLLLSAGVLAWIFYGWLWALVTLVSSLVLAELLRILALPKPDNSYFLIQLLDDFERRANVAESFKAEEALRLRETARILSRLLEGDAKAQAAPGSQPAS